MVGRNRRDWTLSWPAAALALCASALVVPGGARAQALPDWSQGWHSRATIYGWLPSITGSQTRRDGTPVVDLDGVSVLDMLDFAFMGAAETRRGKVGFVFDFLTADLGQDGEWVAERLSTRVKTKTTMATAAMTYRVYESGAGGGHLDVLGGFRVYDMSASFDIDSDRFTRDLYADANWVDPIVGLRGEVALGHGFSASGFADVGGFGIGEASQLTWEVYGGLNYDFSDRVRALAGYRYMSIDLESSDLSMDVDLYGPLIGIGFSF